MSDNDNNGKILPEKTEEQLIRERAERFAKDPNSFIEISELICGVARTDKTSMGISIFVNNVRRSELNNAQVELNCRIDTIRKGMDMAQQKTKIIPAKGGILNFVRKNIFK